MSYLAIALLAAVYKTLGSVLQALYGFFVPYVRRGMILGTGNCPLGLSALVSGFASSFNHFFTARLVGGLGSSPQHPVGSNMLASEFGSARGRATPQPGASVNSFKGKEPMILLQRKNASYV